MNWNWQLNDWTKFTYDPSLYTEYEKQFLLESGKLVGAFKHLTEEKKNELRIELISQESFLTSQIEGEFLNRESIQSSLRNQLGLAKGVESADLREEGVNQMLTDVYRSYGKPLSHDLLSQWNRKLLGHTLPEAGAYRSDPIQVLSGSINNPTVHFEAPPAAQVSDEMEALIQWFNAAHERGAPSPLTIAAISHLWFECIHPYPDGNGRVGRALVEYSLSRSLGFPAIISLSTSIEKRRKRYYQALELSNRDNEINLWLQYFIPLLLDAQSESLKKVDFVIKKAQFYDKFRGKFNARQEKVIARIYEEGIDGFKGGLSAGNYLSITQTSIATATRDLNDLVKKGALTKTGERKYTRYWLNS